MSFHDNFVDSAVAKNMPVGFPTLVLVEFVHVSYFFVITDTYHMPWFCVLHIDLWSFCRQILLHPKT